MMNRLRQLRGLLAGAEYEVGCAALLREIDDDLASEGTIGASISAPDDVALSKLKTATARPYPFFRITLHPYLAQYDWAEPTLRLVRHADALIAQTGARHFMPAILFRLLDAAVTSDVPTLLIVDGMGKMREPRTLVDALSAELQRTPLRNTPRLAFLNDENFTGESLEGILANFLNPIYSRPSETEAARDARLWERHRATALELAHKRVDSLRTIEAGLRASQTDRNQTEVSLLATGESLTAFWQTAVLELSGRIWTPHEERSVSILVGDPHTRLAAIHSTWFTTLRGEFENRINAWVSSAAWHLRKDVRTLPPLTRPLCTIVEKGSERMRAAIEEAERTLEGARGKRNLRVRAHQIARNAFNTAANPEDATITGDPPVSGDIPPSDGSNAPGPVDGDPTGQSHFGNAISEIGMGTNQILNRLAKSRMKGVLLDLAKELRRLGDRAAGEVTEEIALWVAARPKSASESQAHSIDLDETQRQLAVIATCISELKKPL